VNPIAPSPDDESYDLPCAEALLAGSLALMTGHAQSNCARQRSLMARKVRSNLFFLCGHPGLTPAFRTVVQRLHDHWEQLVQAGPPESPARPSDSDGPLPEAPLWHAPAQRLQ